MSMHGDPCSRQPWAVLLCGVVSTTSKAKGQVDDKIELFMDCVCSIQSTEGTPPAHRDPILSRDGARLCPRLMCMCKAVKAGRPPDLLCTTVIVAPGTEG